MAKSFQRPLLLVLRQGAPLGEGLGPRDINGLTLRRNFKVGVLGLISNCSVTAQGGQVVPVVTCTLSLELLRDLNDLPFICWTRSHGMMLISSPAILRVSFFPLTHPWAVLQHVFIYISSRLSQLWQLQMPKCSIVVYVCVSSRSVMSDLCDPMDCSPTASSVHGILQARILEWVAMPCSRGSSQFRDWTYISYVSCIGRGVLYH